MNISKLLVGSTILMVVALVVGSVVYPNSLVMNFAGKTESYDFLRGGLVVLLIGLLVTNPPRSVLLRSVLATGSVLLVATSVHLLLTYQINILDVIVFMQIAIIFGIEALEPGTATIKGFSLPRQSHKEKFNKKVTA